MTQPQVRPLERDGPGLGRPSVIGHFVKKLRWERRQLPVLLLLVAVAFLVLYPIGSILLLTFLPAQMPDAFGTLSWSAAFAEPGVWQSVVNTIQVVVSTQVIGLPIAVMIAWCLGRTDVPGRRSFEFCFWIMFFLPSLGVLTGWLLLFDPRFGLVNEWLKDAGLVRTSPFNLYSFWGIVFIHLVTHSIAVKVMLLTPAFRNLDGAIEEASRICGATMMQTTRRIVLPLLIPALLVVLLMSIIRGLEAFEIELVLGTPIKFQVYSTKIYLLMANEPPEFRAAGMLSVTILAMVLPLIVLQRWASTRRSYVVLSGRSSTAPVRLGRWRWPVFGLLLATTAFMSALPFALLVAGSFMKLFGFFNIPQVWTLSHWALALGDATFVSSLNNMLALGLGTSTLAVVVYVLIAYAVVRVRSPLGAPLDGLSWLPLTIPGIVLGFGYLNMMLEVPFFAYFYGTIGALILVSFLASMPLGVQVLKVQMLQMGSEIEEAGRIVGGGWLKTFRRIVLPLSAPAVAIVAIMIFASTIRAVSTIMLLSRGDNRVLSILQVEFLTDGSLGPASVVGTVIVLISLAAAALVRMVSLRFGLQAR